MVTRLAGGFWVLLAVPLTCFFDIAADLRGVGFYAKILV